MNYTITTIPNQFSLAKEPCWVRLTSTLADPENYNLNVVLKIELKLDSEAAYSTFYAEAAANKAGLVEFYLTPVINEFLGDVFTKPDLAESSTQYRHVADAVVFMKLEVTEYVAGQIYLEAGNLYYGLDDENVVFTIYHGGLTQAKRSGGINYFNWKIGHTLLPFQTWENSKRITDLSMPQPLYFFRHKGAVGKYSINLKVYGPESASLPLWANTSIAISAPSTQGLPILINASCQSLDIATAIGANDIADVHHYTVQIFDDGTAVSEVITFYIDHKYYSNKAYLVYQNGICGFDSFRFTGHQLSRAEYTRNISAMGINYQQPVDGLRRTFFTAETEIIKYSTQYLSKQQIQQLREIMISPRIYLCRDGYMNLIEPTERTKDFSDTLKQLQSGTIEFRMCETNNVWMPDNSYTSPS